MVLLDLALAPASPGPVRLLCLVRAPGEEPRPPSRTESCELEPTLPVLTSGALGDLQGHTGCEGQYRGVAVSKGCCTNLPQTQR